MTESILSINNLKASINGTPVLNGVFLSMGTGELHVLMGPNGSGKSTLAHAMMGSPYVSITSGTITLNGEDITVDPPEVRAKKGLFLGFQNPVEIPGVGTELLVRTVRASSHAFVYTPEQFKKILEAELERVGLGGTMLARGINEGYSGGEKKRNELLQLSVFTPRLAIMDEIDSGLDVDGVQMAARELKKFVASGGSLLVITHAGVMARMLDPDIVYIMKGGKIMTTGGKDLMTAVEENGFESI